jgi:excisionase family DNA binding protein
MMPHCKQDTQFELFESGRCAAELSPRLELPAQSCQEIDVRRAARILGVSKGTVGTMLKNELLRCYRVGSDKTWRILYDSVIGYCNLLRVHYRISEDRLLRKPQRGRLRDEDLLPFPLALTISAREAQDRLRIRRENVIYLIEQGDLVGYQILVDQKASPWRIFAPSLERYIASLHVQAQAKGKVFTRSVQDGTKCLRDVQRIS